MAQKAEDVIDVSPDGPSVLPAEDSFGSVTISKILLFLMQFSLLLFLLIIYIAEPNKIQEVVPDVDTPFLEGQPYLGSGSSF